MQNCSNSSALTTEYTTTQHIGIARYRYTATEPRGLHSPYCIHCKWHVSSRIINAMVESGKYVKKKIKFNKQQSFQFHLSHWGRVTHICISKLTSVGSDNGLSPGRHQAIIWTNAGIMLIGPLGTNFSENLIEIHKFSFKKMHLKMSSGKWRSFCLGLNVLNTVLMA